MNPNLEAQRWTWPLPPKATRRLIREAAGLTQQEVGAQLGVSDMAVSRWETDGSQGRDPQGLNRALYSALLTHLQRRLDRLADGLEHEEVLG